jgi:hypothetical protein
LKFGRVQPARCFWIQGDGAAFDAQERSERCAAQEGQGVAQITARAVFREVTPQEAGQGVACLRRAADGEVDEEGQSLAGQLFFQVVAIQLDINFSKQV